jgi:small multidrug resistance family-3 protein
MIRSLFYFTVAGLCEIGGGYLMWLTLRERRSVLYAIAGAVILVLYGVIPTLQPAHFSRVYAAYGGIFIVLAMLWGASVERVRPDRFDIIGGTVCLAGAAIMMYWPRRG